MATNRITAAVAIAAAKDFYTYDQEHMSRRPDGCMRSAWRAAGNYPTYEWIVVDTAMKSRPRRRIYIQIAPAHYVVNVMTITSAASATIIDRIDLRAADADERLARYELV